MSRNSARRGAHKRDAQAAGMIEHARKAMRWDALVAAYREAGANSALDSQLAEILAEAMDEAGVE